MTPDALLALFRAAADAHHIGDDGRQF